MIQAIKANEGFLAFYSGLSAGMLRQISYGTLRLGLYENIRAKVYGDSKVEVAWKNALCGLTAGATASAMANPVEVSLVRMQADGKLPPAERRNYKHAIDAIIRIGKEEGFAAYFRGVTPTVTRAMVVNMTQLGSYSQAKYYYEKYLKLTGFANYLAASLTAGFIYSSASLPVDNAKTRMQKSEIGSEYSSLTRTLKLVAQREGLFKLWNGFPMYFCRCAGHTIFMMLFLEQYKKMYLSRYG